MRLNIVYDALERGPAGRKTLMRETGLGKTAIRSALGTLRHQGLVSLSGNTHRAEWHIVDPSREPEDRRLRSLRQFCYRTKAHKAKLKPASPLPRIPSLAELLAA
jgi:hypothetical protein